MKKGLKYFGIFAVLVFIIFGFFFMINSPSNFSITGNWVKSGIEYTCENCSDCTKAIVAASEGDIIYLDTSVDNQAGNCINITAKNEIIFDCQGNYIDGAGSDYGVFFNGSSATNNSVVRNCNITDFNQGIVLINSTNITLSNFDISQCYYGIYAGTSHNNTLNNITVMGASTYQASGILFYLSNYNNFTNITAKDNFNGIKMHIGGSGNTFDKMVVVRNSNAGFMLADSNGTYSNMFVANNSAGISMTNTGLTFINVTSTNNSGSGFVINANKSVFINITSSFNGGTGMKFSSRAFLNNVTNSTIENNTQYGLWFENDASTYPYSNLFHGNIINNSINYYESSDLNPYGTNVFNTIKSLSTNIRGGPYSGGNYWANANGTGISVNCADVNFDGICDSSYVLQATRSIDYYPLSNINYCRDYWVCGDWEACSGNTQSRTCTDTNYCGTTGYMPALSQSCTMGGGQIEDTTVSSVTDITSDQPFEMIIEDSDITKVIVGVNEDIQSVSISITTTDVIPQANLEIGLPSGEGYQAFIIETTGMNDSNIENVTIEFQVNKTWLIEQNETPDQVALYRKPGQANLWDELVTTYISEDEDYYYFSAFSIGFSEFLVFLADCIPGRLRCLDEELQICADFEWVTEEECAEGCKNKQCVGGESEFIIFYLVLAIGVFVGIYFLYKFISERNKRKT